MFYVIPHSSLYCQSSVSKLYTLWHFLFTLITDAGNLSFSKFHSTIDGIIFCRVTAGFSIISATVLLLSPLHSVSFCGIKKLMADFFLIFFFFNDFTHKQYWRSWVFSRRYALSKYSCFCIFSMCNYVKMLCNSISLLKQKLKDYS